MKSLIQTVAVAVALVVPVASFAQSNGPVTRAQVRDELIQLESTGYRVGDGDQAHYPDAIQAAEAKVAAKQAAAQQAAAQQASAPQATAQQGTAPQATANSSYGGVTSGSSAAGQAQNVRGSTAPDSLYKHH